MIKMHHDGGERCDGGVDLSEKLEILETKLERNPRSYVSELFQIESQFNFSLQLFHQHTLLMKIINTTARINVDSDLTTTIENLADYAMFLGRVSRTLFGRGFFYRTDFPLRLIHLLTSYASYIPSIPRLKLAQALALLHRRFLFINDTLSLFIQLQTLGDNNLTNFASNHIFSSLWHLDKDQHQIYQTRMFNMLQDKKSDEAFSIRVLATLWNLYQRKLWFDENTANAICTASFHSALGIRTAALSLLLENKLPIINENHKDHDDSDSSHESTESQKEELHHDSDSNHNSPLNHLIDKQVFAQRLLSHLLMPTEEGSEAKMMMLKLTARVIGLHQLTLLEFYPFVQTYVQPHQRDIKNLLLAVVQAFHDKVPHDAVKPLFIQIVNQFVCDGSSPEAIAIGVDAVKEICNRMPWLMNDDILQNLDLYEKADSVAARSLITFFHEFCPFYTQARPEASEEVDFATDIPGNLRRLKTKMDRNPYGYMSELFNIESEFNSSLQLFHQHTVMEIVNPGIVDSNLTTTTTSGSDPTTLAENLAKCAMFLGSVSRYFTEPFSLNDFPLRLLRFLSNYALKIPSTPRLKLAQALTLLDHKVSIDDTLLLFMVLQTLGDIKLTKFASNHVFQSLWRTSNNEHRKLKYQTLMFDMLKESEAVSMRVLVTLWKLYMRKVWFDEKTANVICTASFSFALRVRTAALSLLLENKMPMIENDKDHDDSDSSHESTESQKEDHYDSDNNHDSPLNHLIDKQGFAETLFAHLKPMEEGSEAKMMMLKLTARVIGLHQLTLLDFYPFVQKYVQPHQQDIKNLLLAVVQACHDKVPHDAVKPLFIQIVNQFVCDGSCPEAITIGVEAVKEICNRMPSLMNVDMLLELDLYEKEDTEEAQSLLTFFDKFCYEARSESSEEVDFATDVPKDELLHESGDSNDSLCSVTDHNEEDDDEMLINDESLGTKSKTENSIRKRKFSDISGEFMAGDKVEEQL